MDFLQQTWVMVTMGLVLVGLIILFFVMRKRQQDDD
jgi:LPXTG-motif cell wall-anchored protein